jgi:predicted restriction endonuclease
VSDGRFLIASHIVAWKDDPSIRLHPGNGLCLSAIHDKAFDSHLFSLTDDYRVVLSESLKSTQDRFLREVFWPIDGSGISLPHKFVPEIEFVTRHRSCLEGTSAEGGLS